MANDRPHKVSWQAGELVLHGSSDKYLRHVVAEYLMEAGRIKVELIPPEVSDEREGTSNEENHWPPKEVAPIRSRFDEK